MANLVWQKKLLPAGNAGRADLLLAEIPDDIAKSNAISIDMGLIKWERLLFVESPT